MGSQRVIAVADAWPIIHLAEVESLAFLNLFQQVVLPDEVWNETVGANRVSLEQIRFVKSIHRTNLPPGEVEQFVRHFELMQLHRGEQECLFCCYQQKIDTLLTDDLAVRAAAKQQGITPVGSLGMVIRAFHEQSVTIEDAEKLLYRLYNESSLFVTKTIVELAVEQLHKLRNEGR